MSVTTRSGRHRLTAFVISPLAPAILLMVVMLVAWEWDTLWLCMVVLTLSYGTLIFPGIPLYLVVRKLGWRSVLAYAFIGLLCSFAASVVVWWGLLTDIVTGDDTGITRSFITFSTVAGVLGCAAGLLFWVIARPDRETVENKH